MPWSHDCSSRWNRVQTTCLDGHSAYEKTAFLAKLCFAQHPPHRVALHACWRHEAAAEDPGKYVTWANPQCWAGCWGTWAVTLGYLRDGKPHLASALRASPLSQWQFQASRTRSSSTFAIACFCLQVNTEVITKTVGEPSRN